MERRRALVLAGAMTIAVGATTVALAATGTVNLLGFGGPHRASAVSTSGSAGHVKTKVVTRKRNVYDKFVVSLPTAPPSNGGGSSGYASPSGGLPNVFIPVTARLDPTPTTPPTVAPSAPHEPADPADPPDPVTVPSAPTTVTTAPPPTTVTTVCTSRSCTTPTTDD